MTTKTISRAKRLKGSPSIPGDKSISHRGLIFGAMSLGQTEVIDILDSGDVQSTARCLSQLGVSISRSGNRTLVMGLGQKSGSFKFTPSKEILDCGNSGTTMRLLMGLLSGQEFQARLTGDGSLVKRPMKRVAEPLRMMGAEFNLSNDNFAPFTMKGTHLHGIRYPLKIASAQIKTAIMLAGIQAEGETVINGEIHSRDHTERFLKYFGISVGTGPDSVSIRGGQVMHASPVVVPGDPSTAAFWMAAASMIPNSKLEMKNIALNPTRIGFLNVLKRMGADIDIHTTHTEPEPIGTIQVNGANLKGVEVLPDEIPSLIDEIPILAVLATQVKGRTKVTGAEELRVKESDRLSAIAQGLTAMGVDIELLPDGFVIEGPQRLNGAVIDSHHDHRIAMAFSIAGLVADGETKVLHSDCVHISYPGFYRDLQELTENG